jgi:hypothetical protein
LDDAVFVDAEDRSVQRWLEVKANDDIWFEGSKTSKKMPICTALGSARVIEVAFRAAPAELT